MTILPFTASPRAAKVFRSAEAVYEDVFVFTSNCGNGTVDIASLCVEDHVVANCDKRAYIAGVVNGGNAERIGVGAGRANFIKADAIVIQALVYGVLRPVAGVAGGHGDHGVTVHQAFHHGGIDLVVRAAGAGVPGAEG